MELDVPMQLFITSVLATDGKSSHFGGGDRHRTYDPVNRFREHWVML